ncbi:MAG: iron permease [Pirellula sp.]|nr:iron permease [Pirellula sp.]
MSVSSQLLIYCALVVAASLLGGFIPHWIRLTHTRMQTALSFVAGAMLGVGLLHLVPHAYLLLGSIDRTMWGTLAGFLLMFFIERAFHFHHHGAPDSDESADPEGPDHDCALGHHSHEHAHHGHEHAHDHGHAHEHGHNGGGRSTSWAAALLGLALHSLLDGVALAASVDAEMRDGHGVAWAGLAVFLVVVLHKPFDSLTLGTLMAVGGRSARHRHLVNVAYALAVPTGALLFQLGAISLGIGGNQLVGYALSAAAGTFLCIATSDLLPELQFHTHDRFRLSAALLAGLGLAGAIVFLEERGHDHHLPAPPAPPAANVALPTPATPPTVP